MRRIPLLAALSLGAVALGAPVARAQVAPAEQPATLTVLVFEASSARPARGITLGLDGAPVRTDGDGAVHQRLPAGQHELSIPLASGSRLAQPIPLVAGMHTEVRVTLRGGEAPWVQVDAPRAAVEAAPVTALPPGRVQGQVLDDKGAPVAGAQVIARGGPAQARTDAQGSFELALPPGPWDLSTLKAGYATSTLSAVQVASEETTTVALTLVAAGLELATVTVTAPRVEGSTLELLGERRDSSAVSDVVGAEQMARAGDSNAASALRRVTGLTLVGGRYVYVRGLGERYSSALLGGSTLPSPEPERRVVPLDLFTANQLESLVVQKTYAPSLPGEFGGGAVILRTRRYPAEPLTAVSVSLGYQHGATGQVGERGFSGPTDVLGYDGGARDLPESVLLATTDGQLVQADQFSAGGFSPAALETYGEAMPNRWAVGPWRLPPGFGVSLTRGASRDLAGGRGGYLASVSLDNSYDLDRYWRAAYVVGANDTLEQNWRYSFEDTTQRSRLGGILSLGLDTGGHQLGLTTLYAHTAEALTRSYTGTDPEGVQLESHRVRWVEQDLLLSQLTGGHPIGDEAHLDWRYTFSTAARAEPDRRDWRYDLEPGDPADPTDDVWLFSSLPDNNEIFYGALRDTGHDLGADLCTPFTAPGDREASLKVGAAATFKARRGDGRRFKYFDKSGASSDGLITDEVRAQPLDTLLVPEYIGPGAYQLLEITRSTDSYSAGQNIEAAYAEVELPATERTHLSGGLRVERSSQDVLTYELFSSTPNEIRASLTTLDLLPALTATQRLGERAQLRLGYGRTLSRPDFRELSELEFNDVAGDYVIKGSTGLDRVRINNFDARWELYPSEGESLSAAVFYKGFDAPIELVIIPGAEPVMTFRNAERARNFGVELEASARLDRLSPALADVFVAGNVSFIRSRIELKPEDAGIQTSSVRPLQGQSPWVANAQVGYDDPDRGTTVTALFNAFGPRIASVGANGAPDLYEMPIPQLDLVLSQRLGHGFKLGLKGQNLLNPVTRRVQGGEQTLNLRDGWQASMSLGWSG